LNYRITCVPFFWIPEETMLEHEKNDGVPYSRWVELGLVTTTDGVTIDYSRIYADIVEKILPMFPLLKQGLIGYDPAFATDIATKLRDHAGLQIHEILQNYTQLSEPCHIFEALVKAKRISHGKHRILRNHVENVTLKKDDAGRIRPVKPRKASKHIDGVVATLMGVKLHGTEPEGEPDLFFVGGRP
jgi:phage terminase large subunit-like protein